MAVMAIAVPAAHAQGGGAVPPPDLPPAPPPPPTPELVVDTPSKKTNVYEGQDGRYLMGGTWYFRADDTLTQGDVEHWETQEDLAGWTAVKVPHNWNAIDTTDDKGSVGWYRKEFTLPDVPKKELKTTSWKVRFEGSNYRTTVWLNGRKLTSFTGYFPFEADLDGLRKGQNRLVVKVSSLRSNTDLTHWRPAKYNGFGTGGWWNFGGLLRDVYLRKIDDGIDVDSVRALPHVDRVGGPATIDVYGSIRNTRKKNVQASITANVGGVRATSETREVVKNTVRTFHTTIEIPKPKLWEPGRPYLYPVSVSASVDGEQLSVYRLRLGVKKLEVKKGGIILLNGKRVALRGASIHEDDRASGGVIDAGTRGRLMARHATITRSHYPLDPPFVEALDKAGILYWVDAPVYQLPNSLFDQSAVRFAAKRAVRLTVLNNLNHASVMTWALANEPAGNSSDLGIIGNGLQSYIKDAAAEVRKYDDTRFVSIDRQSRIGEPVTNPSYRYLDVLGVNEYFGWYDSVIASDTTGAVTQTADLAPFLDNVHAANPNLPLVITEFGAEAKGPGPVEQPGSYDFQREYLKQHLAIHASKKYVNGSIVWALRDFRVQPTWTGGAPPGWTTPPWHNKSLIEEDGTLKPAYWDMRKAWRATKPLR
jgi:beta-glucuronidase